MLRLALATSAKYPTLTDDDRLLLDPLARHGIQGQPAIWNDPAFNWSAYDAVVIRSCWDYHLQPEKFLSWIAELESANIPVFNPVPLLRWNANKSYLRDLEAKSIAIVPTLWPEDNINLLETMRTAGWHQAVIKPRISATAYRTQLVTTEQAGSAQPVFEELLHGPGVMLQKFMDVIITEGEWSLMFFGGRFSHAILKRPKPGDFRVQNDFGGTASLADPLPHVLSGSTRALEAVGPTLYARVDGVVNQDRFLLMELELIEPMLFLADHPQAASRFAQAIANVLL